MRTRFTDLVGCAVPVQLAPMGAIGAPPLLRAVAGAGGMAMTSLPGAPAAAVDAYLASLHDLGGPLGFNVLVPFLDIEAVEAAARRCRVVDFYHGAVDPKLVDIVHANGALAGWQVGEVDEARAAVDAGCDLLVARGIEGGGRMYGSRALWPLLAEVLDAVDVPVLAAGGIASGRLLAAAVAAGADGVRVGTHFVASAESGAHALYKEAIAADGARDSVLTEEFATMWPDEVRTARVLRRALDAAKRAPDPVGTMAIAGEDVKLPRYHPAPPSTDMSGNVDAMPMYAGESAGAVTAIEPAADIVRRIVSEAESLLQRAAATVPR